MGRPWKSRASHAKSAIAIAIALLPFGKSSVAEDWPQFLGKSRNGVSSESSLIDVFPQNGPTVRWRVPGGVGMSAIVVQGELALTTWNAEGKQWLVAMGIADGKVQWKTPMGPAYKNAMGDGPRATPTIEGKSVYAFSGEGILLAADLQSGRVLWKKDLMQELSANPSEYGMACSPLVVDGRVIVQTGAADAAIVALDSSNGELLWKSGAGHAGYSSPILGELGGTTQVIAVSGSAVMGISPKDGELLWSYPFETDYGCNTASPVAVDGGVFVSAGENHGSVLLEIKQQSGKFVPSEKWKSLDAKSVMRNEWQTSIVLGDYLYGFDNVGAAGPITHFACIESKTGKAVWQKTRFGKGNMVYADGKFWITTIDGELVIARADKSGFKELSRTALVGKNRQAISIANGYGYLRDDNEIVCVELKSK